MKRENFRFKTDLYCFFFVFLCIFFVSCEGVYTVQGKVIAINGEPLPGVCVSSPETFRHVITNTKGNFIFRISKPISKLEFIKSDYLPYTVSLHLIDKKNIVLPDIFLTPKPFNPGVYFLNKEKNNYTPLVKGKIGRTEVEGKNSVPSVKISEIITIKDPILPIYVFRLPQYDLTLYQMKEYISTKDEEKINKKVEKTEEQPAGHNGEEKIGKKLWIPDRPILTHTEFLSEMDTTLFVLKPVNELKPGVYCVNWRAFEVPFPRINDCFLFSVEEEHKIDSLHEETASSQNSSKNNLEKTEENKQVKN